MKIKILTIEGCDRCEKLRQFLKQSGLKYSELPCDSNSKDCNTAENVTGSRIYPMVLIENEYTGKKEYVYGETRFESLRPVFIISENTSLIPTHSIDGMINWIKKKLN